MGRTLNTERTRCHYYSISSAPMPSHKKHTIKSFEAHQRIDVFALNHLKGLGTDLHRSVINKTIADGNILVNGLIAKPSYVLKTGDVINIDLDAILSSQDAPSTDIAFDIPIIFQNEHFIVIDKPAGIKTHPADANDTSPSVTQWIKKHFPAILSVGEDELRPGIVHRLDKNTSGLLIIAKTQDAFIQFKKLFKERHIQKTYYALVFGHTQKEQGSIDLPIARSLVKNKRIAVKKTTSTKGFIREALTHYSLKQRFQNLDLLEVQPKTGRMHQIRVHLFALGHPIVGDTLYFFKDLRRSISNIKPERHLLHAGKLEFDFLGESYAFSSPLPEDFHRFLQNANENSLQKDI